MGLRIRYISPNGRKSDYLFDTFTPTFEKYGHKIVNDVKECDIVFFDYYSGLGSFNVDELDYVVEKKLPVVCFDATDFGAMSKEKWFYTKNYPLQREDELFLKIVADEGNLIYFMRKMDKTATFPDWVLPYELIMYPDHDFPLASPAELINREYDICFIGNTSPTRNNAVRGLLNSGEFKIKSIFPQTRLPHNEWLEFHKQSKLFLEACGGGFGSERPYQLITISPMLKVRNTQLIKNDFIDGEDCLMINEFPTKEDIQKVREVLNDPFTLHSIYTKGVEKMKRYFNAEYRANYILETIKERRMAC